MIFSILYRQQSFEWLTELSNKIEINQPTKQSIRFSSSTVLALYIKRKYFVSYGPISNSNNANATTYEQSDQTSSSKLSFTDWIDLLFNGDFRQPIKVTEWPMKFH